VLGFATLYLTYEFWCFYKSAKYKMKKALIFGVSGQDGAYLAKLLLSKGYTVYGTSRDAQVSSFRNLEYLGIHQQVQLESAALNDFRSVLQVLKKTRAKVRCTIWLVRHRWGCRLSNQWRRSECIAVGTLNILEAMRFSGEKGSVLQCGFK
jgi:GDPmannose 4,6-dehydratase